MGDNCPVHVRVRTGLRGRRRARRLLREPRPALPAAGWGGRFRCPGALHGRVAARAGGGASARARAPSLHALSEGAISPDPIVSLPRRWRPHRRHRAGGTARPDEGRGSRDAMSRLRKAPAAGEFGEVAAGRRGSAPRRRPAARRVGVATGASEAGTGIACSSSGARELRNPRGGFCGGDDVSTVTDRSSGVRHRRAGRGVAGRDRSPGTPGRLSRSGETRSW